MREACKRCSVYLLCSLFRALGLLLMVLASAARGEEADIFDFFEEEAEAIRVVTVSRLPHATRWAPATVYVITDRDIEASGAKTFWDLLRRIPGVEVTAVRAFYGEVSIRGLTRALSNRTLVLLDGRRVLNGPFDTAFWEGLPVTLDEVDRIEVVEGPASALYGANAINGVINIVTRTPEQIGGGKASYAAGERHTHLGSFVYGGGKGRVRYKAGAGWRSTYGLEDADLRSSRAGKVHLFLGYDVSKDTGFSLSGGMADYRTQFSRGEIVRRRVTGTVSYRY